MIRNLSGTGASSEAFTMAWASSSSMSQVRLAVLVVTLFRCKCRLHTSLIQQLAADTRRDCLPVTTFHRSNTDMVKRRFE